LTDLFGLRGAGGDRLVRLGAGQLGLANEKVVQKFVHLLLHIFDDLVAVYELSLQDLVFFDNAVVFFLRNSLNLWGRDHGLFLSSVVVHHLPLDLASESWRRDVEFLALALVAELVRLTFNKLEGLLDK